MSTDLAVLTVAGSLLAALTGGVVVSRRRSRDRGVPGRTDGAGVQAGLSAGLSAVLAGHQEQAIEHLEIYFGLVIAIILDLIRQQANLFGNLTYRL